MVYTKDRELKIDVQLDQLAALDILWYWVDFIEPTEDEAQLLKSHFHFHPLAVEDCYHILQRPKLDYYDGYDFFVLHTIDPKTLKSGELDLFLGSNFLVTYQMASLREVDIIWKRLTDEAHVHRNNVFQIFHLLMDKVVDEYFPTVYQIEDEMNVYENEYSGSSFIDGLHEIRSDLLRLRRTIFPMRELTYRIINSDRLKIPKEQKVYFLDVHDHLLKLSEIVESIREMTSDIRDSYLALNANRMNKIMMTLTLITTIFMPLTFLAGIYGMNFLNMPELEWTYGYFIVLGVMFCLGFSMFLWFKSKGWLER